MKKVHIAMTVAALMLSAFIPVAQAKLLPPGLDPHIHMPRRNRDISQLQNVRHNLAAERQAVANRLCATEREQRNAPTRMAQAAAAARASGLRTRLRHIDGQIRQTDNQIQRWLQSQRSL